MNSFQYLWPSGTPAVDNFIAPNEDEHEMINDFTYVVSSKHQFYVVFGERERSINPCIVTSTKKEREENISLVIKFQSKQAYKGP